MNDTNKGRWLLYLLFSLTVVFWIGVITAIFNLVYVAIACTVYCILGMTWMFCRLHSKEAGKRRFIYEGIGYIAFCIPAIICLF